MNLKKALYGRNRQELKTYVLEENDYGHYLNFYVNFQSPRYARLRFRTEKLLHSSALVLF